MGRGALVLVLCGGSACSPGPRPSLAGAALTLEGPSVVPLLAGPRPVVRVRVDGHELPFLVDTGSALSFLELGRAGELGLDVRFDRGAASTRGSSGQSAVVDRYVPIERFELGGLVLEHTVLAVLDDEVLRAGSHRGLLGQDVLARLALVLDMERRALHLLPPDTDRTAIQAYLKETALGEGAWAVVPVEFRPSPFLPMDVRGAQERFEIEVDTGATDTLFPERLIDVLQLAEAGAGTAELRGVGGSYPTRAYRLEDFGLYGLRITTEVYSSPLEYALLGMDVLGEFVLLLDGPGRTLWLHHRTVVPDTGVFERDGGAR